MIKVGDIQNHYYIVSRCGYGSLNERENFVSMEDIVVMQDIRKEIDSEDFSYQICFHSLAPERWLLLLLYSMTPIAIFV